jgi:hypothetical protein
MLGRKPQAVRYAIDCKRRRRLKSLRAGTARVGGHDTRLYHKLRYTYGAKRNWPADAVAEYRKATGTEKRKYRFTTGAERKRMRELRATMSVFEIAEVMGLNWRTILDHVRDLPKPNKKRRSPKKKAPEGSPQTPRRDIPTLIGSPAGAPG